MKKLLLIASLFVGLNVSAAPTLGGPTLSGSGSGSGGSATNVSGGTFTGVTLNSSTVNGTFNGNGAGLTNVPITGGVLVMHGGTTTSYPSLTNAISAAVAGDTVWAMAGTYYGNCLLKQNVNIRGEPGAHIIYQQTTTNDAGFGIFDDRFSGATTNTIEWPGNITFLGLTNLAAFYDTVNDPETFEKNLGTRGAIVITNALTKITGRVGALGMGGINSQSVERAGLFVENCNSNLWRIDKIYDPYAGITFEAPPPSIFTASSSSTMAAFFTADGSIELHCPEMYGGVYSWHWKESVGSHTNDVVIYPGTMVGTCYGTAHSLTTRGWVIGGKELTTTMASVNALSVFGSGKWYFDFQKISTLSGVSVFDTAPDFSTSNAVTWIKAMKMSNGTANSDFITATIGTTILDVMEFEDLGGAGVNGINTSGNGRIIPHYSVSGLTNISASASSLVVSIIPPMPGTNYTPQVTLGFNPVATMSVSTLTRSNFTINFSAGVTTGGNVFWEAKQNIQ